MHVVGRGALFGLGNPLLDISATVGPDYLAQYGLKPFDAILAEEKHQPIFKDLVANYSPDYIAGGSTQNSIRVAQWLLREHHATTFSGCVGADEFGRRLAEVALRDGVNVQYSIDPAVPTGTCAVLVCAKDRSLVTNLGAANHFKLDHLLKPELAELIEAARVFYSSGFFLTVSVPSALHIAKHACEKNKIYVMSLAAPFVVQFFTDAVNQILPYADYVVGNEHEAAALGEKFGFGTDLREIGRRVCGLPKQNALRPRTVIFTQGANPALIITAEGVKEFPVIPCPAEKIVDLNGAGDAWLGGFLAYLVQEAPLEKCVAAANYAANVVIQRPGCTYPPVPSFVYADDKKKKKKDKDGKKKDKKKDKKDKEDHTKY